MPVNLSINRLDSTLERLAGTTKNESDGISRQALRFSPFTIWTDVFPSPFEPRSATVFSLADQLWAYAEGHRRNLPITAHTGRLEGAVPNGTFNT